MDESEDGIWFAADHHFWHEGIIKFCNRSPDDDTPFESAEAMNEYLIERHNERVGRSDRAYFVGDFAFWRGDDAERRAQQILDRLKGRKHLIVGNHDSKTIQSLRGWESVEQMTILDAPKGEVLLCHYPMVAWPDADRGRIQLYGHVHGSVPGNSMSTDVGVDANPGMSPISLTEVRRKLQDLPAYEHPRTDGPFWAPPSSESHGGPAPRSMGEFCRWYVADYRFWDEDAARSRSPDGVSSFGSVEEMNSFLIERHNSRVSKRDVVYIVGGFSSPKGPEAARRAQRMLDRLNGQKCFVPGAYDSPEMARLRGWSTVSPLLEVSDNKLKLVLSHAPLVSWNGSVYDTVHLHGLCRGGLAGHSQATDVGVDVWGYAPANLVEIQRRLRGLPPYDKPDFRSAAREAEQLALADFSGRA